MTQDSYQKFTFQDLHIRGAIVRLDKSYARAIKGHEYPDLVSRLLGEMMAASILLSGTLKFKGKLSIHARGSGPISLLMAEATNERTYRGIAKWEGEAFSSPKLSELLGDAQLAITIDPDNGQRYQGIVPLERDLTAECIAHYFEQSEQLDTHIVFHSANNQVVGLFLQKLPDYMMSDDQDAWNRILHLVETIEAKEFTDINNEELIYRLFHQETIQLFDSEVVSFKCSCSRQRSLASIQTLGKDSAIQLLEQEASIKVDCQFCQTHYEFGRDEIFSLFEMTRLQ